MALPGLSTLGITFGYGAESVAGSKPSTFKQLTRINSIGGITITPETIDASALEDTVQKSVAGRGTTGGQWTVTVNLTDDTSTEWKNLIEEYNALGDGKQMWFEVIHPQKAQAFFVIAQPPQEIPMPEMGQNELFTAQINLTIVDYKGEDTKVAFS